MLNLRTQQKEKEFFELSELPFPTLPQKSPGSWKFFVASNLPCLFNVGNGLKVRPSLVQGFVQPPETMRNRFPIFVQHMRAAAKRLSGPEHFLSRKGAETVSSFVVSTSSYTSGTVLGLTSSVALASEKPPLPSVIR